MTEHTGTRAGGQGTAGDAPRNQRCTICGVVLAAAAPPSRCPECGARSAMFEPTDEPAHGIPHNPFQPHDAHEVDHGDVLGPGGHGCVTEE